MTLAWVKVRGELRCRRRSVFYKRAERYIGIHSYKGKSEIIRKAVHERLSNKHAHAYGGGGMGRETKRAEATVKEQRINEE